jgi:phosphoribulokinase
VTNQKQGDFVPCSLFLKIEGAWLNSEQSQVSSSYGVQGVQTQKLRHSDFGYLLETASSQYITYVSKLQVPGRHTLIDKVTLHIEVVASHLIGQKTISDNFVR